MGAELLRGAAVVAAVALAVPVRGEVPVYAEPVLKARANFSGAYNLPNSVFFTNSTPALSAAGVAIKLEVLGPTTQGVFLHDGISGAVVFEAESDAFISDVSINADGVVVFPQFFSSMDGIWFYDHDGASSGRLTNLPLGASSWSRPQVDDQGRVGYRAGFVGGQAFASWDAGQVAIHATEVGIDVQSPYSFLFTPSTNGQRQIAGKVRRGGAGQTGESQPDEIRIFESNGSSVLIAEDRDADPTSPYTRFDNSVSLTNDGWVAFTAELFTGGRGVFLSDGVETRTIAHVSGGVVTEIESFAPAANDQGQVVFRGRDANGLRAIFVGDGSSLVRVIGEHDLVDSDLGVARIDQHDASPVFGGSPAIAANGAIAFHGGLTPPGDNQIEWGSGLFVVEPAPLVFADGFETGDLTAWSAVVP